MGYLGHFSLFIRTLQRKIVSKLLKLSTMLIIIVIIIHIKNNNRACARGKKSLLMLLIFSSKSGKLKARGKIL